MKKSEKMLLLENDPFMNEAFELIERLGDHDEESWDSLERIYEQMSKPNRTEIARKIIETSRFTPTLIDGCTKVTVG